MDGWMSRKKDGQMGGQMISAPGMFLPEAAQLGEAESVRHVALPCRRGQRSEVRAYMRGFGPSFRSS